MGKIAFSVIASILSTVSASAAPQLTYLSCELPPREEGKPTTYFNFTLDEQNGTVSYYVKEAEATNKEKAVFGAQTVTWTVSLPMSSTLTRTISRIDLSFTEELNLVGIKSRQVGQCSLLKTPARQF